MNPISLRSLTWLTFTAAIAGALLLADGEPSFDLLRAPNPAAIRHGAMPLPSEPTAAGPLRQNLHRVPAPGSGASAR